jgi:Fe-S cluster assembly iron-binding protein IscA
MKINTTNEAIEEIKKRYDQATRPFRIMINGFGWGGPVFGLVQDEQTSEDHVEIVEDIKFIVHEDLLNQFGTFKVDFISNFFRKSFVVSTGNHTGTC